MNAGGGRSIVSRISEQTPKIINDNGDVESAITNYRFNVHRYILKPVSEVIFQRALLIIR